MGRAAALPGAGLIFFLEGLGLPIPVEIPLGIIGWHIAHDPHSYWVMVLLMWSTTVLGNTVGYFLGYYGGRPMALKLISLLRVKHESWHRVECWFRLHGLKVIVFTRWINWGFAQNIWLCGITRLPPVRFFTVMLVNDLLWAVGWTWLAETILTLFRRYGHRILHFATTRVSGISLGLILTAVGLWLLYRWWQRRKTSQAAPERASTLSEEDSAPRSPVISEK